MENNKTLNMSASEFDQATMKILQDMRKQYGCMTSADIQTIGVFANMFKETYLTEKA